MVVELRRQGWVFTGWMVAFGAAGWGLWKLGLIPSLAVDWADPLGWLSRSDLDIAVAALVRMAGLAIVGWVLASSLAYLVARVAGADPARLDWLAIGPIRRAVDAMLAGSLVVALSPLAATAADVPAQYGPSVVPTPETTAPAEISPRYVPIPAGPGRPGVETETTGFDTGTEITVTEIETEDTADDDDVSTVVVAPGDSLWKLAERRLQSITGKAPGDGDIAPYWLEMIEANRDRIRSGDPDLIFPGEELVLPPVPLDLQRGGEDDRNGLSQSPP